MNTNLIHFDFNVPQECNVCQRSDLFISVLAINDKGNVRVFIESKGATGQIEQLYRESKLYNLIHAAAVEKFTDVPFPAVEFPFRSKDRFLAEREAQASHAEEIMMVHVYDVVPMNCGYTKQHY